MTFGSILVLAVGLAMDATAVAAARGTVARRLRPRHVLMVGGLFGGFQALMPLLGWMVGSGVSGFVREWDHWVAFVLLAAIGGKMIQDSGHSGSNAPGDDDSLFGLRVMVLLAVATSIDALAAGITLPMMGAPLTLSIATIGITTASLSIIGLFAGRRFGARLGRRLDVVGGVLLVGIGFKILLEHLYYG